MTTIARNGRDVLRVTTNNYIIRGADRLYIGTVIRPPSKFASFEGYHENIIYGFIFPSGATTSFVRGKEGQLSL